MSYQQMSKAYIYQPGGTATRIYGVAGPGTETRTGLGAKGGWSFCEYRFTKEEAEAVVEYVNAGGTLSAPKAIRLAFLKAMSSMFDGSSLEIGKKKRKGKAKPRETPLFNNMQDGTSGAISL